MGSLATLNGTVPYTFRMERKLCFAAGRAAWNAPPSERNKMGTSTRAA